MPVKIDYKSYIKSWFFKTGTSFLNHALTKVLVRFGLTLWGPFGWIASFVIDKILVKAWNFGYRVFTGWNEQRKAKGRAEKYIENINKPDATEEEIKDEGFKFLNS